MEDNGDGNEPKTKPISKLIVELTDTRRFSVKFKLLSKLFLLIVVFALAYLIYFFFSS